MVLLVLFVCQYMEFALQTTDSITFIQKSKDLLL
jgi:hypothetical protein